jgi:hypothetical protein
MAGSIPISNGTALVPACAELPEQENANAAETDLWIFRDGRKTVSGPEMLRDLAGRISQDTSQALVDSLIQAGELEAAISDLTGPDGAVCELTDTLAWLLCTGRAPADPTQIVQRTTVPDSLSISPPEGFTYYALHPSDFSRLASRIPLNPHACAVVGIRSIGTTLSAMTSAALKAAGRPVSRITVRPTGHPYARSTCFNSEQLRWIVEQVSRPAQFLVVDEGPGRSGSTFLSVAEALVAAGVQRDAITILGSRGFDPESLCAQDAAARWRGFRFLNTIPCVNTRFENCLYVGGGEWRKFVMDEPDAWPESWTQMERLKFLSPDRKTFFKFEGMGPSGADVRKRAFTLADASFSPKVADAGDGFLAYDMLNGKRLQIEDVSQSLLEHSARYCAFRLSAFPAPQSEPAELRRMLEFNVHQEFGRELKLDEGELISTNPVLADGRMQPYEWLMAADGGFVKTDAISHGDNHFFPGPCDIAWDLAGAAVEWALDPGALNFLLARFRDYSGKDASKQLPAYMLAYSVFRLGFCKMAISTVLGTEEEARLRSAYLHYRASASRLLDRADDCLDQK